MAMQEEGMPMAEKPQGGGGKEAETLISGVAMAMGKVAEMLPKLGGSEEDMAAMQQLQQAYQQLVSKVLGGGEEAQEAPEAGQAPAMAGPRGVPMG